MSLFPIFLKLENRQCIIVGAGKIAAGKAAGLLSAGAKVVVIAPRGNDWVRQQEQAGHLIWKRRAFSPQDVPGATLAVAATNSKQTKLSFVPAPSMVCCATLSMIRLTAIFSILQSYAAVLFRSPFQQQAKARPWLGGCAKNLSGSSGLSMRNGCSILAEYDRRYCVRMLVLRSDRR